MAIEELKERIHSLVDGSDNQALLEDLLLQFENRLQTLQGHEAENLSKEDYDGLIVLVNEPPEKDTVSYQELKSSLSLWFTK